MTTTMRDAQALTYLACRLREDTPGAGKWDDTGTYAVIRELLGHNLAETVRRVLGHAMDPGARTPGAIRRPFTPQQPAEPGRRYPAKVGDECKRHPGEYVGACRACAVEDLGTETDPVVVDGDTSAGRALRDAIRAARAAGAPGAIAGLTGNALIASAADAEARDVAQQLVDQVLPDQAGGAGAFLDSTSAAPPAADRPETACAADGCFRPTRDGICDRCRADMAAQDVDTGNAALIETLRANQRERARTRPAPDPDAPTPRHFGSGDYHPGKVRDAMRRAAHQRRSEA